jgi:hypothetical protein
MSISVTYPKVMGTIVLCSQKWDHEYGGSQYWRSIGDDGSALKQDMIHAVRLADKVGTGAYGGLL